ncbi:MAG: hypothetical protein ACE362_10275 [Phaeodactylibacter xiamenensis]|uniref:Uncharacterized protein n=1 Tax=Phaeodactylibacter xiamenensis TaxID=1524460 RepID=A0A098S5G4_9BACT|nr:hypothetical protein [Phaeodactylibacter xiamenensis]KGE87058.1 hypothetical protein IX84_18785 [Phaeodactylibacter xiamenensis]MCR9050746.1 hypothetical protein [bacterium]
MFKRGDFVRVKPGTVLDTGEIAENWGGEIFHVNEKDGLYGMGLDAPTIDSLSDEYLTHVRERGEEVVEYYFKAEDLEHAPSRSTEQEIMAAIERLVDRERKLELTEESLWVAKQEAWKTAFRESPFFEPIAEFETSNVSMAVDSFLNYLYNYECVLPEEWAPEHVRAVCLEWAPGKVTARPEEFRPYGKVVIAFLRFLGDAGHIKNAAELIETVEEIKDRIPVEAAKESNWGPAKAMMMEAMQQGVDLSSKESIEAYLMQRQMAAFAEQPRNTTPPEDPFKGIGRNQKITVRYADGEVRSDIKFKKVEKDLRAGKCEITSN